MRSTFGSLSVLAVVLVAGCTIQAAPAGLARGSSGGAKGGSNDGSGVASVAGQDGGLAGIGGGNKGTPPPTVTPDQCTDASKLVYVVSRDDDLYSFRPDSAVFTRVGTMKCPAAGGAFPFSMAVDRAGTAWTLYTDGVLYKVSTADASCTKTAYAPGQAGFQLFGMGFASDGAGAATDSLYVSENVSGNGLGKIDLATLTLTRVAAYGGPLAGQRAELTGTGNGDLFGFFTTNPAQVAKIAKASGAVDRASPLASVQSGTDWAFSFWGGDFYLYTGNSTNLNEHGSAVTRYRPSDGSTAVVASGIGFFITGAGVSTCAPTVPPPPPPPPPPPK